MKGKLIVLDGTDGSGKATQTELLKKRLEQEGRQVEVISFPQYGRKSAGMIEEYLAGSYGSPKDVGPRCASVFYACDRYDAAPKIRKWLQEGKIVIANRYVFSSMGHQAGIIADLKERDVFLAWLEQLEYIIFKVPKPDLNILLFVPAETGQKRWRERLG